MTINHVKQIITTELCKSGYKVVTEERQSKTSSSLYYKIYNDNGCELMFRVSDHPTYKNVITLRVDRRLTEDRVRSFIKNRLSGLKKRSLKQILGI